MGGHALPSVPTQRLSSSDYQKISDKVIGELRKTFSARAEAIPAYRTKADFGDLDVIVEKEKVLVDGHGHDRLMEFAKKVGFARAFLANGNVLSYDHRLSETDEKGFQVDLILTPAKEFDMTRDYFSFNDLGNLIGRTAHKMGFKYGHRGLLYPFRDGTHLFTTLDVSADNDEALHFLGYDPKIFRNGFDAPIDIFNYVTGSTYFNRDIFLLENRNHTSRVRDRKRKTYTDFLLHLDAHPDLPGFEYPDDKSIWLPKAFEAFPNFKDSYRETESALADSRFVKTLLNGENLSEWTGLSGARLGQFIGQLRSAFENQKAIADFLRSEGKEGLKERVMAQIKPPKPPTP